MNREKELWASVINDCRCYNGSPEDLQRLTGFFQKKGLQLAELSAPPDPDEHLPDDQYIAKKQERFALNPQSDEDPAPVLVAFSERDIERIAHEYRGEIIGDPKIMSIHDCVDTYKRGLRYANTRAVSVDQLVEAATEVLDGMDNSISFIYVDDLREAFTKLVTVSNS